MTTSISQDIGVFSSGNIFPSFDEKICRVICEGIKEDFQACLKKGLCPNYCLQKNTYLKNLVFPKGAPLIFVIVHCCKKTSFHWDLLEMARLLLERNVNLELSFECEGGGKLNVMEYACEQANDISLEMLLMLLGAATPSTALLALNRLNDPEKRKEIQQKLFLTSPSLPLSQKISCSVDENQLCRDLLEGKVDNLRKFFEQTLNPNYVLTTSTDVHGFLCREGDSLLMTVLRACAATKCSMQVIESLALLIEYKVNLEQTCLGIQPLHYVCKNESLFSKHVISCLLTCVNQKLAFSALEHMSDPIHKNMFKNILISKTAVFQFSDKQLVDENQLCHDLLEGKVDNLRKFFEQTLNPNYVLTTSTDVHGFLCREGDSLLMTVLRAYVATKCSMKVVESLALLVEHNVNLEQTCLGTQPLHYVCENENLFSSDVITCLLNSVSKQAAFTAVEYISDPLRRSTFEDILNLKICPFTFVEDKEANNSYEDKSHTKKSSLETSPTDSPKTKTLDKMKRSSKMKLFPSETSKKSLNLETSEKCSEKINLDLLLLQLENNDLSELKKIVSNSEFVEKYDAYIKSNFQRTLICFLFSTVKNKEILYKVSLCFFQNGFFPDTLIVNNKNFLDFLFELRNKFPKKELSSFTYLQLLCLTLFFTQRPVFMKEINEKLESVPEKKRLKSYFQEDFKTNSIKSISIEEHVINNYQFYPLVLAFLDASLIQNKNVITQQSWQTKTYFMILTSLMNSLCTTKMFSSADVIRMKNMLLQTFSSVLESGLHPNNFQEKNRYLFVSWLQKKSWYFLNFEIEVKTWNILQKQWNSILLPKISKKEMSTRTFQSPISHYFTSYLDILENLTSTLIMLKSSINLCMDSILSHLEHFLLSTTNPITNAAWNQSDICCLLHSTIVEICEMMDTTKKLTIHENSILFILKCLLESLFIVSKKHEFLIDDTTSSYIFLETEINRSILNTETKMQFINLLNKYWNTNTLQSQEIVTSGKRKRVE